MVKGLFKDILGTIGIGKTQAQESAEQAQALQQEALKRLDAIGIPSIEAQRIVLEAPELVGLLVPELEGYAEQLGTSAMEQIQIDPALKQKQMLALSGLEQRAEMGLTEADKAELNAIARQARGEAQARDSRILQSMAERGMGGSGAELAARLASSQAQTQQLAEQGQRQAADAFNMRMQALQQLGSMAGNIRGQEYGEQSNLAQARDVIQQENLKMRQAQRQRDIERQNQAQAMNLAAKQQIENQKKALQNQQEQYNKALIQQQFQNQVQKAGGAAAQLGQQSQLAQQTAANQQAAFGQLIGAGTSLATGGLMGK